MKLREVVSSSSSSSTSRESDEEDCAVIDRIVDPMTASREA